MEWRAYGPGAALIRFDGGTEQARAITTALEAGHGGVREFSIAFDQLLLEFVEGIDPAAAMPELMDWLPRLEPIGNANARLHRIEVRYEGEDLADLAARTGLDEAEVARIHAAPIYDVAMLGFSPGFPYLTGLDERLTTPRRSEPRTHIRAGAVAIGGEHTGIYSIASPGGWNVIGHTEARLFDPAGEQFLLRTGDRVKFIPT